MNRCRVLVVDDHKHAQEAICDILSTDPLFEVVGVVSSGSEAIAFTEQWMPDLILMDIRMSGMSGLEATGRIKVAYPYVKIIMITVSDDIAYLLEALKQGAQGYLLKNLAPSTWIEYLKSVVSEEAPLSRELAFQILKEFSAPASEPENDTLTIREREILRQVASGLTNREAGEVLGISEHTVKNHLKNILQKLQLQNRVQLTRYAMEKGWVGKDGFKGE
ncbi:response regulator transcription factor [Saccharibacillus sp. JS10]|uniref:response regulator n=1 Tax=Saccharibacillus sp. JS10 TaxID=2950552 RepID=UPI00210B81ED|nr:response regulator transcription factor [Saccharibacillus sp. JS10]MCQ4085300.1 response regulator transcription factor [Saccharibacillus sp. JS10]